MFSVFQISLIFVLYQSETSPCAQLLLLYDSSPGLHPQKRLLKASPASSPALNICDETWSVRETLPHPPLYAVRTERRQEAERVVGQSSFHHLPTTHT